jgi:hypothetical protein
MLPRGFLVAFAGLSILLAVDDLGRAACCYFSAKSKDIQQPAQKVFITWDPAHKKESFTVQPRFTGNARDFGMVIPTPSQPKLDEMPRDFFKELAVYTILKQREFPQSQLAAWGFGGMMGGGMMGMMGMGGGMMGNFLGGFGGVLVRPPAVAVVETGVVGSLDYKIIRAGRADDLFAWLKNNKYQYSGDEATLDFYIKKKWFFTVMKIDTLQMKKKKDGSYTGEVTPTRFSFTSDKLVYPVKITQLSVKDQTEALFYVQAPYKVDLEGDLSYQHHWVAMLEAAQGCTPGGLPGKGDAWLKALGDQLPALKKRSEELGFTFASGQRPGPNSRGRTPTTMEWAKRLTQTDILVLQGRAPYSETVPNPDFGFTVADMRNPLRAQAVSRVIQARLQVLQKARPNGFLVRTAPLRDVFNLRLLLGHLQASTFITKFRKTFTRDEMNDDLILVRARQGQHDDSSEYEEMLPSSPP